MAEKYNSFWHKEGVHSPDVPMQKRALNILAGQNVLVTGATGKIGREIVDFLSQNPLISIRSTSLLRHPVKMTKQIEHVRGDLTNPQFASEIVEGVQTIFHCAAISDQFLCQDDPEGAVKENVSMVKHVSEGALHSQAHLVVLCSGISSLEPFTTSHPSVYGQIEYEDELFWKAAAKISTNQQLDQRYIIARFGSAGEHNGDTSLREKFLRQAYSRGSMSVFEYDANRRVTSLQQILDLLSFVVAEPKRTPNGSIVTRSDMPVIVPFNEAQDIANHWQDLGIKARPSIVITGHNPAIRSKDVLFAPQEVDQTIGFGANVVIPPVWKKVGQEVHLSYPVKGERGVLFEYKVPAVEHFNILRGVTEEKPMGDYPHTLEICPVAACNFGCPACSYATRNSTALLNSGQNDSSTDTQRSSRLSKDVAFNLIEQLKEKATLNMNHYLSLAEANKDNLSTLGSKSRHPIPGIFIAGWGEPTLAPWLRDFIIRTGEDFPVALCTNASLLEKTGIATREVLSKMNLLLWSLYSPDATSFPDAVMSGDRNKNTNYFDSTERSIKKVLDIRKNEGLDFTFSIKVLLTRKNFPLIWQLYDYANQFNPDRLVIRLANNFEPDQDVELSPYERHMLRQLILGRTGDNPQHPLRRFADVFLKTQDKYVPYTPKWVDNCHHLTSGQFGMVDPDGKVYLSVVSDGKLGREIGNVNSNSWNTIWSGDEHKRQVKVANWEYAHHTCGAENGACRHADANFAINRFRVLKEEERAPFIPNDYYSNDGPFV